VDVYWVLTESVVRGMRYGYRLLSAGTVLRTGEDLIMFDTGFGDGGALERELARLSLRPEDFTFVFNTHLHIDHMGGNLLFRNAKKVVSRQEYLYQKRFNQEFISADDKEAFIRGNYRTLTDEQVSRIADTVSSVHGNEFEERIARWEDSCLFVEDDPPLPGCVQIIRTPGHTPFHLSFKIRGKEQAAVVPGDLIPSRRSFLEGKNSFIEVYTDRTQADMSMKRLRLSIRAHRETVVHPSHDRPFVVKTGRYVGKNRYQML
jgi:glyoxylase-like metal-dependent hydrolase (beta-lactamase superfamily II)